MCEKRKNGPEYIRGINLNKIQRSNERVSQDKDCLERHNAISFPEAAILLVSDGDRDLWPDGILSPQIADFRLHCAESKVKPKMAERSGPDTFLEGVKFGLEKVGKANITLKQKQEEILKIIALTQKDVLAVLPTGYGKSKKDWHSAH